MKSTPKINRDVVAAVVADAERREMEFPPLGLGDKKAYERVQIAVTDPEAPEQVRFVQVSLVDGGGDVS